MRKRNRKPFRNWSDLTPAERGRISWRCAVNHSQQHSAILLSYRVVPSMANIKQIIKPAYHSPNRKLLGPYPLKELQPIHDKLNERRNYKAFNLVKNLSTLQAIGSTDVDLNWLTINQLFRGYQENRLKALRNRLGYSYCYIFAASEIERDSDYTLYELVIRGRKPNNIASRTLTYGALVNTFTKGFPQPTTLHKSIEHVRREARQLRANIVAKRFHTNLFDFSKPTIQEN